MLTEIITNQCYTHVLFGLSQMVPIILSPSVDCKLGKRIHSSPRSLLTNWVFGDAITDTDRLSPKIEANLGRILHQ